MSKKNREQSKYHNHLVSIKNEEDILPVLKRFEQQGYVNEYGNEPTRSLESLIDDLKYRGEIIIKWGEKWDSGIRRNRLEITCFSPMSELQFLQTIAEDRRFSCEDSVRITSKELVQDILDGMTEYDFRSVGGSRVINEKEILESIIDKNGEVIIYWEWRYNGRIRREAYHIDWLTHIPMSAQEFLEYLDIQDKLAPIFDKIDNDIPLSDEEKQYFHKYGFY